MHTPSAPGSMLKQNAKPPVFVDGPSVADETALSAWIAAHEARDPKTVFELPFTIWRGGAPLAVTHAELGVQTTQSPTRALRLDDTALGVPLIERLAQRCGKSEAVCMVRLSGRFGELLSGPRPGAPSGGPAPDARRNVFSVLAVGEVIDPSDLASAAQATLARVQRAPGCLAIRMLVALHCARGAARCEKCRAAAATAAMPRLLDVCPDGDHTRPTIALKATNGATVNKAYDVLRSFSSSEEATAFAAQHGISDIILGSH